MKFLTALSLTIALCAFNTARADHKFAQTAAASDLAEITLGKIAMQKAESADVKKFAERMVADHTKSSQDLMQIAQKKNIELPKELSKEHAAHIQHLQGLRGADFDREYMKHMMKDHQDAVQLFSDEANNGKDEDIKNFASKYLPTIKEHAQMTKEIGTRVGATGNNNK